MEETLDLEAQNPGPDVDKKLKALNVLVDKTRTKVERAGRAVRNRLSVWKIPLYIYQTWLFFFMIFSCLTMFTTKLGVVTYKYDSSLSSKMNQTANSLELAMEGSTQNFSSLLPPQWPSGTYTVGFFFVCRKNDNSKKVCYRGKIVEDLILKDIGIQIAEYNGMKDPAAFGETFLVTYREVQKNLRKERSERSHCHYSYSEEKRICEFEGLTAEEASFLPSTRVAENPQIGGPYLYLVQAALLFISLSLLLWDGEDGVAVFVSILCTAVLIPGLTPFLVMATKLGQPMEYFVDESHAFAFTMYLLEPAIPSMAFIVIFNMLIAET
ncbi:hypothetical protein C7M61_003834 [Candidozyma pseudohaemuli]|uniref:Uncharacterized protein n=1 Tax=Candidozyma pseudohaemuli TaxID=418784 RepID=A0A2P7YLY5_9ASCO|nr:hypothetical protein C7M61_003834 [[Candida] pseudohaemulonii]PSK36969.1 hypothetical protein C7M61_003834 [[Candida] pseudohaemulonii]